MDAAEHGTSLPKRLIRKLSCVVPAVDPAISAVPCDGRGGRDHKGRGCEPGKSDRSMASLMNRGACIISPILFVWLPIHHKVLVIKL